MICWQEEKKNSWAIDDQSNPVFTLHPFDESDTLLYHSALSSKGRKLWNINGQHGRSNIELCLCSNTVSVLHNLTHPLHCDVFFASNQTAWDQLSFHIHSPHNLFRDTTRCVLKLTCLSHSDVSLPKHSSKFSAPLVGQSVSNPL